MDDPSVSLGVRALDVAQLRGDLNAFARSFAITGGRIAWLLGAGSSAMSGIPTAEALILRFKHALYCGAHRLDVQELDSADRGNRARIEAYFDGKNGLPPIGHPDEYAVAFERMYPSPSVRADFIAQLVRTARPNYGHHVLAAFMALDLVRLVLTTNFDDLVEQAGHSLLDSQIVMPRRALTVGHLTSVGDARRAFQNEQWPLVGKMHGDFRSDRLKNTPDELRTQDTEMRSIALGAFGRFGLIVCGYSGRDESVMQVLREALTKDQAFPGGLYWCHRPAEPPSQVVRALLAAARQRNVHAEAIEIDNFIEFASALERAVTIPQEIRAWLDERRPAQALQHVPFPVGATKPYPVLRLNALPVTRLPTLARLLEEPSPCELAAAQRQLRERRTRGLIGRRSTDGQLVAFGHDEELQTALVPLGLRVTDQVTELRWTDAVIDASDLGLALDALTLGLGRTNGLRHVLSRRGRQVRVLNEEEPSLLRLRQACGGELAGTVPGTAINWAEAVGLNLDRRDGEWWLLLNPEIWVSPSPRGDPPSLLEIESWRTGQHRTASEFVRDRRAQRYNRSTNAILDAWVRLLATGRGPRTVNTWHLAPGQGVDPTFEVVGTTAYSRPLAGWVPTTSAAPA